MTDDSLPRIELARAVQAIRDELVAAAAQADGEQLRFEVGEIQMEFAVELRHDARVKGGVKAWVFSADVDAGRAAGRTHKVAFTLKPKNTQTNGGWDVGNEDVDVDTSDFGNAGR
jgi:Trypsin-co-occurring domain 2